MTAPTDIPEMFLEPPAATELSGPYDPFEPAPPGTRFGAYEVTEVIGRGGMGDIYRGRRADRAFDKDVAVKVLGSTALSTRLRARFHHERQLLAQLEHPNITRLLDGGTTEDGRPFLVMEFVPGTPIDVYCRACHLGVAVRVALFRSVCAAVRAAHRRLIVHRDLKPSNILVTTEGQVKLLDFGIATLGEAPDADVPALTPEYASPEQLRGEALTTATDVYSLGVVLHELLTERRPAPDRDRVAPSATRRRMPGGLDAVVRTALAVSPEDRYGSVEQLDEDLERWQGGFPPRAAHPGWGQRTAAFVRRHRLGVCAASTASILLLAALAALGHTLQRTRDAHRETARAQAASAEVLAFYETMFVGAHPYENDGSVTLLDLIEAAEAALDRGAVRPEVEAGIRVVIARSHSQLMQWERALPHLARALSGYRRDPGTPPAVLADCLSLFGRALCHTRQPGAVAAQTEALALRRAEFGDASLPVAETLGNLAYATWTDVGRTPDHVAAEAGYRESIRRFHDASEGGSRDAARVTMSLGFLLQHLGRLDEAEALYRTALTAYEALPHTEDLYEVATLRLLARVLLEDERYDEAGDTVARLVELAPLSFHPDRRCRDRWCLVAMRRREGRLAAATQEARGVLAELCRSAAETAPPSEALALERCALELRITGGPAFDVAALHAVDRLKRTPEAAPVLCAGLFELAALMGATGTATQAAAAGDVALDLVLNCPPALRAALPDDEARLHFLLTGYVDHVAPIDPVPPLPNRDVR